MLSILEPIQISIDLSHRPYTAESQYTAVRRDRIFFLLVYLSFPFLLDFAFGFRLWISCAIHRHIRFIGAPSSSHKYSLNSARNNPPQINLHNMSLDSVGSELRRELEEIEHMFHSVSSECTGGMGALSSSMLIFQQAEHDSEKEGRFVYYFLFYFILIFTFKDIYSMFWKCYKCFNSKCFISSLPILFRVFLFISRYNRIAR
jgi:hypothetical protein